MADITLSNLGTTGAPYTATGVGLELDGINLTNPDPSNPANTLTVPDGAMFDVGPDDDLTVVWCGEINAASTPPDDIFTTRTTGEGIEATIEQGAPPVLSEAVLWLDASYSTEGEQTAVNQGTGGAALNAQYGSGPSSDTNDPLLLTHTGDNYVYLPGTAGNSLTCPGFTIPDTEGKLLLPYTDGDLTIEPTDITDAGAASFTASTGQTVTVNRSTSGLKTALVTRPIWLFGTDDYLEVADNPLLNFGADDDATILIVTRIWGIMNYSGLLSKRLAPDNTNPGWALLMPNARRLLMESRGGGVTDDWAQTVPNPGYSDGQMIAATMVRRTTGNNTTQINDVPTNSNDAAIDWTNPIPLLVAKSSPGSSAADIELMSVAVWRRALTTDEIAAIVSFYDNPQMTATVALHHSAGTLEVSKPVVSTDPTGPICLIAVLDRTAQTFRVNTYTPDGTVTKIGTVDAADVGTIASEQGFETLKLLDGSLTSFAWNTGPFTAPTDAEAAAIADYLLSL